VCIERFEANFEIAHVQLEFQYWSPVNIWVWISPGADIHITQLFSLHRVGKSVTSSVKHHFGFRFPTVFGGFGDSIGRAESWKLGMDQNNTFLVSAL